MPEGRGGEGGEEGIKNVLDQHLNFGVVYFLRILILLRGAMVIKRWTSGTLKNF